MIILVTDGSPSEKGKTQDIRIKIQEFADNLDSYQVPIAVFLTPNKEATSEAWTDYFFNHRQRYGVYLKPDEYLEKGLSIDDDEDLITVQVWERMYSIYNALRMFSENGVYWYENPVGNNSQNVNIFSNVLCLATPNLSNANLIITREGGSETEKSNELTYESMPSVKWWDITISNNFQNEIQVNKNGLSRYPMIFRPTGPNNSFNPLAPTDNEFTTITPDSRIPIVIGVPPYPSDNRNPTVTQSYPDPQQGQEINSYKKGYTKTAIAITAIAIVVTMVLILVWIIRQRDFFYIYSWIVTIFLFIDFILLSVVILESIGSHLGQVSEKLQIIELILMIAIPIISAMVAVGFKRQIMDWLRSPISAITLSFFIFSSFVLGMVYLLLF